VRLYYLDESEGKRYYVRSALGVDEEVWNEVFNAIRDWRREVMRLYHIPYRAILSTSTSQYITRSQMQKCICKKYAQK